MRRIPIVPTIIVLAAVATMIALGFWQLRRAEWKEGLIARYQAAQAMSSEVPWPRGEAAVEQALFRVSGFTCTRVLSLRQTAGTAQSGAKGWEHLARCAVDGGGEAEVALGWSAQSAPPQWAGGAVHGLVAPGGRLILDRPVPPLQPLARPDPADLPNNHLAYAGQWFFFAVTALVIYVLALRRRRGV